MESSWVKAAAREEETTSFKRNGINMVVAKRSGDSVRKTHFKYPVDKIECVSFNLGDFGLARDADDLVHTFAGQHPNLSPWKSYWAMGLCPDTPRKAIYTTTLQMGSIWIGCKGGSAAYLFSNVKYLDGTFLLLFYHKMQTMAWCSGTDQPGQSSDLHNEL